MSSSISIVVPCLNEQDNLAHLLERIFQELERRYSFEVIVVDDGSTDETLTTLKTLSAQYPMLRFISLSRNFGHQQALKAGIDKANGQCVITMDADLQHPPELLHQLIQKWREGFDIVYTVRKNSPAVTQFKKLSAKLFYYVVNKLAEYPMAEGAADFRLMDRRVVAVVSELKDPFLFLRGLVPWLGFKQCAIPYTPDVRFTGHTKYSLAKMMALALHGVTSVSVKPLRLATVFGVAISGVAFLYLIYAIFAICVFHVALPGWASILSSVLFLGGIQLLFLGVLGEYLGMLYVQSKDRPSYIIREQSRELHR